MLLDYPKLASWKPGRNRAIDLALFRNGDDGPEVFLVARGTDTTSCPGMPALPVSFINAGESVKDAARRLAATAGLGESGNLELMEIGIWGDMNRHPRNSDERHLSSTVYAGWVHPSDDQPVQELDHMKSWSAAWVALEDLKRQTMAFDHGLILSQCCKRLGIEHHDPRAESYATESPWHRSGFDAAYDPASELTGKALEFAHGSCADLAIALNAITGWPIRAATVDDESEKKSTLIHAWVEMPNGLALDAHGVLHQDELLPRYEDSGYADVQTMPKIDLLKILQGKKIPKARLREAEAFATHLLERISEEIEPETEPIRPRC